eukprot:784715-Pyramimonas_sp.AAC.1
MGPPQIQSYHKWIHRQQNPNTDGSTPNRIPLRMDPHLIESCYRWIHLSWNPSPAGSTTNGIL